VRVACAKRSVMVLHLSIPFVGFILGIALLLSLIGAVIFQFHLLDSQPASVVVFWYAEVYFQFHLLDSCGRRRPQSARGDAAAFQFHLLDSGDAYRTDDALPRYMSFQFHLLDSRLADGCTA